MVGVSEGVTDGEAPKDTDALPDPVVDDVRVDVIVLVGEDVCDDVDDDEGVCEGVDVGVTPGGSDGVGVCVDVWDGVEGTRPMARTRLASVSDTRRLPIASRATLVGCANVALRASPPSALATPTSALPAIVEIVPLRNTMRMTSFPVSAMYTASALATTPIGVVRYAPTAGPPSPA